MKTIIKSNVSLFEVFVHSAHTQIPVRACIWRDVRKLGSILTSRASQLPPVRILYPRGISRISTSRVISNPRHFIHRATPESSIICIQKPLPRVTPFLSLANNNAARSRYNLQSTGDNFAIRSSLIHRSTSQSRRGAVAQRANIELAPLKIATPPLARVERRGAAWATDEGRFINDFSRPS